MPIVIIPWSVNEITIIDSKISSTPGSYLVHSRLWQTKHTRSILIQQSKYYTYMKFYDYILRYYFDFKKEILVYVTKG